MGELTRLPNVGKVLEKNLNKIGIYTEKQLKEIGSREAFVRIRMIDSGACLHMLYGLQGAIDGIKDSLLPLSTKQQLKVFYRDLSGEAKNASSLLKKKTIIDKE
jgi:DNA transformation protein